MARETKSEAGRRIREGQHVRLKRDPTSFELSIVTEGRVRELEIAEAKIAKSGKNKSKQAAVKPKPTTQVTITINAAPPELPVKPYSSLDDFIKQPTIASNASEGADFFVGVALKAERMLANAPEFSVPTDEKDSGA